jgi:K+-transporting ATPase KdpF subunit
VSRPQRQPASKEPDMALYLLLAMVVALVIYLFYAVIHPEKF